MKIIQTIIGAFLFLFVIADASPWEPYINDPEIRVDVDFWVKVNTQITSDEGFIHDSKYLNLVYETINFNGMSSSLRKRKVQEARTKWRDILFKVHAKRRKPEQMDEIEKSVFLLFSDIPGEDRFLAATQKRRIRYQRGQKDVFRNAIVESGNYLSMMENVFQEEGVPMELTRLPFVESSFNYRARSKVGASGIWQFIPSTGRLYMIMNDAVDERNDPIWATRGAARLLKRNYESLGSWPLAVMAYNHGRLGILKATHQIGSNDVKDILKQNRSRRFGFASRNFFPAFLAAVLVERSSELYFGKIERSRPVRFDEVTIRKPTKLSDAAEWVGIPKIKLAQLNPALTDLVYQGKRDIPVDFRLRIPLGSQRKFWDSLEKAAPKPPKK